VGALVEKCPFVGKLKQIRGFVGEIQAKRSSVGEIETNQLSVGNCVILPSFFEGIISDPRCRSKLWYKTFPNDHIDLLEMS